MTAAHSKSVIPYCATFFALTLDAYATGCSPCPWSCVSAAPSPTFDASVTSVNGFEKSG
ncbi:hypothetical protein PF002_g7137 [Phytophthora fragariae]|uniref:Pectate lyase n=1 Tax=Phytophthora fragariae TaxID=53985 RepID=A0A6A3I764_9STRA|nr:hypothetical protein PF011_g23719 [Phytophthora fragariae]KAE9238137.1 hypothetical protein PF004_g8385 [Phytophthora fragariae]KAE9245659.1 hypothetical protein PF002_g7137 [Phytophthora fragariae]